jgi:hypothetical protein
MRMARALAIGSKSVYALDIHEGCQLAVRAVRRGTGIQWLPVDLDALQAGMETGAAVVAGLSAGPGMTAWLSAPLADARKARLVLPSLLDTRLPFALDDCRYAFSEVFPGGMPGLPVGGEGTAALAVAARRDDLVAREQAIEATGCRPHYLDHEGLALWSGLPSGDPGKLHVMVWCRPSATLVVLGYGTVYWSSHQLPGIDLESIMRVVRLQRRSVAKGVFKDAPLHWCLGGDEDRVAILRADLDGVPSDAVTFLPDGRYFLARMLAQRALLPGSWQFAALAGPDGEALLGPRVRRRMVVNLVVLLAASVLLAGSVFVRRQLLDRQLRQMDRAIDAAVMRVTGYPVVARGRDAVLIAERELAGQKADMAVYAWEGDLSVLAGRIAEAAAQAQIEIMRLRLSPPRVQLEIRVEAGAPAVARMRQMLEAEGFVLGIQGFPEEQRVVLQGERGLE